MTYANNLSTARPHARMTDPYLLRWLYRCRILLWYGDLHGLRRIVLATAVTLYGSSELQQGQPLLRSCIRLPEPRFRLLTFIVRLWGDAAAGFQTL